MNKKIKEASREEIAKAYKDKVPQFISNYRRYARKKIINEQIGEVYFSNTFTPFIAERYGLGFEYRVWRSNKNRKYRLSKRIEKMIRTDKAVFLTLTFNDKFFERETSADTRRRYISRFLKEQCQEYVANIDFGEDNGREHYHAVVVPKNAFIDYVPYNNAFDKSRIYAEHIKVGNKSLDNITRYIDKLTNHALKENGHYKRLIYSRD